MSHPYTIGLDLGDRTSRLCILDPQGEVVEEGRLRTSPGALRLRFEAMPPSRIVLEVGGHSAWTSRLLEELGHEVIVANARKLRFIYDNESKSDKVDAEALARVGRLDPKLLAPIHSTAAGRPKPTSRSSAAATSWSEAAPHSSLTCAAQRRAQALVCQDAPHPPSQARLKATCPMS